MATEEARRPPEAAAMFVVILNTAGADAARAEVVAGLDGVRDTLLRQAWTEAGQALAPAAFAALLDGIEDPARWRPHGTGDGRPYWHWWSPLGEGSVSVQRLTVPLPAELRATAALRDAASSLAGCAAALRQLAAPGDLPSARG